MINAAWEDAKQQYRSGNIITQIILVNLAIFLFFNLFRFLLFIVQGTAATQLTQDILHWFSMPADGFRLLTRPWSLFTNMFLHFELWHFLWNMLYLYWFGAILRELIGGGRVLGVYVFSGLAGALVFFLSANLTNLPIGEYALGASAAIMGVILAAATTAPNYQINMLFIGSVKLMYVAFFVVFLDLISIPNLSNTGGHLAHLGGAFMGFFLVRQMQAGNDWTEWFNTIFQKINSWTSGLFAPKAQKKVVFKVDKSPRTQTQTHAKKENGSRALSKQEKQAKIDAILDKIKQGGYESLTDAEKAFLFRASKDE